jgi:hypothetical protein
MTAWTVLAGCRAERGNQLALTAATTGLQLNSIQ